MEVMSPLLPSTPASSKTSSFPTTASGRRALEALWLARHFPPCLRRIYLHGKSLRSAGAGVLGRLLPAGIQRLSFYSNGFSLCEIEAFQRALAARGCTIEDLAIHAGYEDGESEALSDEISDESSSADEGDWDDG
mmetsp:Transcript_12240/g.29927  ORF Transcript_12240/g.29927 Transcript_12240/m.29927 type:complete len:135 (-) Transcript_12240:255-659(-)